MCIYIHYVYIYIYIYIYTHTHTCTPMFIAALFTIAKKRKQPKCPLTEEWIKVWYIYIQWNVIQSQKKMK